MANSGSARNLPERTSRSPGRAITTSYDTGAAEPQPPGRGDDDPVWPAGGGVTAQVEVDDDGYALRYPTVALRVPDAVTTGPPAPR